MAKGYTKSEALKRLKKFQGKRNQRDTAADLGISQQHLCDILNGRRGMGPKILQRLRLEEGYIESESAA